MKYSCRKSIIQGLVVAVITTALVAVEASEAGSVWKHKILAADSSKQRIALIDESGATLWEYKIGPLHDLQMLPNGNILFQKNWTHLLEVDPSDENRIVWEYDAQQSPGNPGRKIEVHAFQRLGNGNTMIAESGATRILEVDRDGNVVVEVPMQVKQPHPHRDTRLVRKTSQGTYLVAHEGDGAVREYDVQGNVVWSFDVPLFDRLPKGGHGIHGFGNKCFAALRLKNGNTLIATGNGHSVLEVTPEKTIVWSLHQNDLPGIQLAWVTTLQVLPNGHIVVGNCHAGPQNPQVIEITRDKQVVGTFHDFERFGNALSNSVVVSQSTGP